VDVDADVVVLRNQRLSGVNAHPDAEIGFLRPRMRCERMLGGLGGADGVFCVAERDEETIALCIDLSTAVVPEHLAEEPPVISQDIGVTVAELVQETGRTLDVREEEGHPSRRQFSHGPRDQHRTPTLPRLEPSFAIPVGCGRYSASSVPRLASSGLTAAEAPAAPTETHP